MSWGYVAVAAAGAYSSYQSGKGADAQRDAANMSMEQKRRNYALIRKDTRMSRMSGEQAQIALNDMLGLESENPYDEQVKELSDPYVWADSRPRKGDFTPEHIASLGYDRKTGAKQAWEMEMAKWNEKSQTAPPELAGLQAKQKAFNEREKYDFKGSPGYQFRLFEGEQALERSQAGRRLGGRSLKEAMRYGQGFATREYEAQFNRLSSIANRGQNAVGISAGSQPNILGESQMIGSAGAQDAANQAEIVGTGLSQANQWNQYNEGLGNDNTANSGSLY